MENDLAAIASRAERHASEPRYRGEDLVYGVGGCWPRDAPSSRRYPAYLQERWWAGNAGELLGKWDTMASGGAGWLLSAGQVEKWVREAVTKGVAARRRTRRANAPVRGRLMEILNWITRRPRADEMLRLDRATRISTRRSRTLVTLLASAANDRRHRPC